MNNQLPPKLLLNHRDVQNISQMSNDNHNDFQQIPFISGLLQSRATTQSNISSNSQHLYSQLHVQSDANHYPSLLHNSLTQPQNHHQQSLLHNVSDHQQHGSRLSNSSHHLHTGGSQQRQHSSQMMTSQQHHSQQIHSQVGHLLDSPTHSSNLITINNIAQHNSQQISQHAPLATSANWQQSKSSNAFIQANHAESTQRRVSHSSSIMGGSRDISDRVNASLASRLEPFTHSLGHLSNHSRIAAPQPSMSSRLNAEPTVSNPSHSLTLNPNRVNRGNNNNDTISSQSNPFRFVDNNDPTSTASTLVSLSSNSHNSSVNHQPISKLQNLTHNSHPQQSYNPQSHVIANHDSTSSKIQYPYASLLRHMKPAEHSQHQTYMQHPQNALRSSSHENISGSRSDLVTVSRPSLLSSDTCLSSTSMHNHLTHSSSVPSLSQHYSSLSSVSAFDFDLATTKHLQEQHCRTDSQFDKPSSHNHNNNIVNSSQSSDISHIFPGIPHAAQVKQIQRHVLTNGGSNAPVLSSTSTSGGGNVLVPKEELPSIPKVIIPSSPAPPPSAKVNPEDMPPPRLLNYRFKNVRNFPKYKQRKNSSFEKRLKRNGLILDPKEAITCVRKLLQDSINRDMEAVLQKFMKTYFLPAIDNIRQTFSDEAFTDADIEKLRGRIMKRALKKFCSDLDDDSDTSSGDDIPGVLNDIRDNASDSVSECSNVSGDRREGKLTSPFPGQGNQDESDTESGQFKTNNTSHFSETRKPRKRKYAGNKNLNSSNDSSEVPRKRASLNSTAHCDGDADIRSFDTSTKFLLGSSANSWLGFSATRGRMYSKHPTMFRYHCDPVDKGWLVTAGYLNSHGVKAFLVLAEEVKGLGSPSQTRHPPTEFSLPDSFINKIKSAFGINKSLIEFNVLDGVSSQDADLSPDVNTAVPFTSITTTPFSSVNQIQAEETNSNCFFNVFDDDPHALVTDDLDDGGSVEEDPLAVTSSFTHRPAKQTSPQPPTLNRYDSPPFADMT